MMDSLTIGRVAAVHGFRIKVELDSGSKSPSRAGLSGVQTAIAINSYVSFDMGAGECALGIITDLEAMETLDPYDREMTLELVKPRRVASVQLLGTIKATGSKELQFDPGITVLPTLDTLAQVASAELLDIVFKDAPKRNPPEEFDTKKNFDYALELGTPVASRENRLYASYNDLFSRPLAVVGNTGSGKSYTVACLLERAMRVVGETSHPRFFVLDINGEYGRCFDTGIEGQKQPDMLYLNGKPFSVPIWLMNAREVCLWLGAAEQTQEPVLKDFWSLAKGGGTAQGGGELGYLSEALIRLEGIIDALRPSRRPVNQVIQETWGQIKSLIGDFSADSIEEFQAEADRLPDPEENAYATFADHRKVLDIIRRMKTDLSEEAAEVEAGTQKSADKPVHFPIRFLRSPKALIDAVRAHEDDGRLRQWISTSPASPQQPHGGQAMAEFLSIRRSWIGQFRNMARQLRDWF